LRVEPSEGSQPRHRHHIVLNRPVLPRCVSSALPIHRQERLTRMFRTTCVLVRSSRYARHYAGARMVVSYSSKIASLPYQSRAGDE
jgi:hypothetical protein